MRHRWQLSLPVLLLLGSGFAAADDVVVFGEDEAAAGLELQAVVQLAREARDLEDLERRLNDPDAGVNNLDLNADGEVDYVRVVGRDEGDTHVAILQAVVGDGEYQDVATIQIDRDADGTVALQVQGDVEIYGPDYYVVPVEVHVHAFPLVTWYYGPHFHVWVSPFRWHLHPSWWHPWPVVSVHTYRAHVTRYSTVHVSVTRVNHVTRAGGVYTTRTTSTRVTRTTRGRAATRGGPDGGRTAVRQTTTADGAKRTRATHTSADGTRTTRTTTKRQVGDKERKTTKKTKTKKTGNAKKAKARKPRRR